MTDFLNRLPVDDFLELWVFLGATPLLWLTVTVTAYALADSLSERAGRHPLMNPVVFAAGLVAVVLLTTSTSYTTYFSGAQFVHFLLGPATVSLGVPLVLNWPEVRSKALPILAALLAGAVTAVASVVAIALAFGLEGTLLWSLAPKSVTTPIAMGISVEFGGIPSLTAVFVIMTGILGAVMVTPLMNALRIEDPSARGFAAGVAAHGIGTARAFQVNPLAGLFAGIAMALNGLATALLVSLIAGLV
ncbi:MAG: LrgB family protein [Pseudomonadota bacterium]